MLLVHSVHQGKFIKASLLGFITSSRGLIQEISKAPKACTSNEFDPNSHKLMEKSGYDFRKLGSLGQVIEAKPYGLNETQKWYKGRVAVLQHLRLALAAYHPNG